MAFNLSSDMAAPVNATVFGTAAAPTGLLPLCAVWYRMATRLASSRVSAVTPRSIASMKLSGRPFLKQWK